MGGQVLEFSPFKRPKTFYYVSLTDELGDPSTPWSGPLDTEEEQVESEDAAEHEGHTAWRWSVTTQDPPRTMSDIIALARLAAVIAENLFLFFYLNIQLQPIVVV